jgi:hypothetical protein
MTNSKVWLAQWGLTHWGKRVKVVGYEAHDCTRVRGRAGWAGLSWAG